MSTLQENGPDPVPEPAPPPEPETPCHPLVMVVHGVGDTGPGVTADAFMSAYLASAGDTVRPDDNYGPSAVWLDERYPPTPAPDDPIETFPVHIRRARSSAGGKITCAEVYWSDLSTVKEGRLYVLWGLVMSIFGLHHVSDEAAAQPGWFPWLFRSTLYLAAYVLTGPVASLVASLAVLLLVSYASHYLTTKDTEETSKQLADFFQVPVIHLLPIFLTLIGLALFLYSWWNWKPAWKWFWVWFFIVSVLVWIMLRNEGWLTSHHLMQVGLSPGEKVTEAILALLHISYLLLFLVMLFAFFFWAMACGLAQRDYRPGLNAALITTLIQLAAWALLVPILLELAERLPGFPNPILTRHPGVYIDLEFHLTLIAFLSLVVLAIWVRRSLWAFLDWLGWRPPWGIPRLVVSRWIVAVTFLLGGFALLLDFVSFLDSFLYGNDSPTERLPGQVRSWPVYSFFSRGVSYINVIGVVLVLILPLVIKPLRAWLHILTDIINHFYRSSRSFPLRNQPVDVTHFEIQQRIESRCQRVLEMFLTDTITDLVIIAHSQGAVIAVDVLNKKTTRDFLDKTRNQGALRKVQLVTMGSPLNHLYQHYFPMRYPPLTQRGANGWDHLFFVVDSWLNLYRRDDFVGMEIAFPNSTELQGCRCTSVDNIALPPGGHTGYWKQRSVWEKLKERLP